MVPVLYVQGKVATGGELGFHPARHDTMSLGQLNERNDRNTKMKPEKVALVITPNEL